MKSCGQQMWFGAVIVSLGMSAGIVHADHAPIPVAPGDQVQAALPAPAPIAIAGDELQPPTPPPPQAGVPVPLQTPPPGEPRPAPRPPQAQTPRPQPSGPPPPSPPRVEGQPINIRIDLTISDEGGTSSPVKKTVSMTVGDREFGQIRSEAFVPRGGNIPLHVDARPALTADGKIRLQMTLNYNLTFAGTGRPATGGETENATKTEIREQLGFILENGKPLVVSQSADPIGERKVTVEVKATVLR